MKKNSVTGIIGIVLSVIIVLSVCSIYVSAVDGRSLSEYYGFSYESYMNYLYSHEHDDFYLGTPYRSGNWRSPNGDTSYNNGARGMNCSGFVWHVLKTCIQNAGGNPSKYQILSYTTPRGWFGVLEDNSIEYYIFNNKYEALASGVMSKGDIIMMFCNEALRPSGQNHIGIYWGDGSSDVFWHSAGRANYISHIRSGGAVVKFIVAKMSPKSGTLKINLYDSNSDALSGGEFKVYTSSGSFSADVKSGGSVRLNLGTYTVVQTKTAGGYKIDSAKKTVSISSSNLNPVLTFLNNKKLGAASVQVGIKRFIPSLFSDKYFTYAGVCVDVYSDAGCTKKLDTIKTNADGRAVFGYENGRYSLSEGTMCYFKLSKENAENFKNIGFDYDSVLSAKIVSDCVTASSSGEKTILSGEMYGAVKAFSEPGDIFMIYYDNECTDMCFTPCSDEDSQTVYGMNIASADENAVSFFGYDNEYNGCNGYRLGAGKYTVSCEDDSVIDVTVRRGCVTDLLTGEIEIEADRGDFDLNGSVSVSDARGMLRASAKMCAPVSEQMRAGDLDSDGKITASEARRVLRFCAKLEKEM